MNPQPFKRPTIWEAECHFTAVGGHLKEDNTLKPGAIVYDDTTQTLQHHPSTDSPYYLAALLYCTVLAAHGERGTTRPVVSHAYRRTAEQMINPAEYRQNYETHLLDPHARAKALGVPTWVLEAWEDRFNSAHLERLLGELIRTGKAKSMTVHDFFTRYYRPDQYARALASTGS